MSVHTAPATRIVRDTECAARTHFGTVRSVNEDRYIMRPDVGVWAVCDGVGGHGHGDVASQMVVDALQCVKPQDNPYALLEAVTAAAQGANAALRRFSTDQSAIRPIGTTLVTLLIQDNHFACLWAGDSRVYRLRDGSLEQVTRDHSMAQELVDAGLVSPEQARTHPQSNVITRALGMEKLTLERRHGPLHANDTFLLCSDGLTGVLSDDDLSAHMRNPSLRTGVDAMIHSALDRGARDNVTAMLVRSRSR